MLSDLLNPIVVPVQVPSTLTRNPSRYFLRPSLSEISVGGHRETKGTLLLS